MAIMRHFDRLFFLFLTVIVGGAELQCEGVPCTRVAAARSCAWYELFLWINQMQPIDCASRLACFQLSLIYYDPILASLPAGKPCSHTGVFILGVPKRHVATALRPKLFLTFITEFSRNLPSPPLFTCNQV